MTELVMSPFYYVGEISIKCGSFMFQWIHSVMPHIYRWAVHVSQCQGTSPWVKTRQRMNGDKTLLIRALSSCLISADFLTIISSSGNRLQATPGLSRFNECSSFVYLVDLRLFRRSECKNIHKLTLEIVHRSFLTNVAPSLIYNPPSFNIKYPFAQLIFLLSLPLFYSHITHI